jgi:hypothetical protein
MNLPACPNSFCISFFFFNFDFVPVNSFADAFCIDSSAEAADIDSMPNSVEMGLQACVDSFCASLFLFKFAFMLVDATVMLVDSTAANTFSFPSACTNCFKNLKQFFRVHILFQQTSIVETQKPYCVIFCLLTTALTLTIHLKNMILFLQCVTNQQH